MVLLVFCYIISGFISSLFSSIQGLVLFQDSCYPLNKSPSQWTTSVHALSWENVVQYLLVRIKFYLEFYILHIYIYIYVRPVTWIVVQQIYMSCKPNILSRTMQGSGFSYIIQLLEGEGMMAIAHLFCVRWAKYEIINKYFNSIEYRKRMYLIIGVSSLSLPSFRIELDCNVYADLIL